MKITKKRYLAVPQDKHPNHYIRIAGSLYTSELSNKGKIGVWKTSLKTSLQIYFRWGPKNSMHYLKNTQFSFLFKGSLYKYTWFSCLILERCSCNLSFSWANDSLFLLVCASSLLVSCSCWCKLVISFSQTQSASADFLCSKQ